MIKGGETLFGKHWKYDIGGLNFLCGTISEGEPDELVIEVYLGTFNGNQSPVNVKSNGIVSGNAGSLSNYSDEVLQVLSEKYSYNFNEVIGNLKNLTTGDTVPDWETYEEV